MSIIITLILVLPLVLDPIDLSFEPLHLLMHGVFWLALLAEELPETTVLTQDFVMLGPGPCQRILKLLEGSIWQLT
jgi:hypothetical protein